MRRSPVTATLAIIALVAGLAGLATAAGAAGRASPATAAGAAVRPLAIASIRAVGDPALGLAVTATFGGDVESALGRGTLRSAVLALVLYGRGTPAGLVDDGGGSLPTLVPLPVRRAGHTSIETLRPPAVAPDRLRRTGDTGQVIVLRDGDRWIADIPSADLPGVVAVKLEAYVTDPAGAGPLTPGAWRRMLRAHPYDEASVAVPAPLTCTSLSASINHLTDVSPADLEPELVAEQATESRLQAAVRDFPAIARRVRATPGLRLVTRAGLEAELRDVQARVARLRAAAEAIGGLAGRINALIRRCAAPASPPAAPPTTTATTPPPAPTPTTPAPGPVPASGPTVAVTETDPSLGEKLTPLAALPFTGAAPPGAPLITIDDAARDQPFWGLGAAMTDSAAWLIEDNLSAVDAQSLLGDLFGSQGIGLNFLRVPMGASDFTVSPDPYTYDDMSPGQSDPLLSQFSIAHDLSYILPAIEQARAIDPALQISANPWSPPAWMKANDSLDNVGLGGTLLPSADQPLAQYFVRFIEAYQSAGVTINDVVPQNEPRSPGGSGTSYPGMTFPESDEAAFISQDLEPALAAAGLDPQIYGNDLSWDKLLAYAQPLAASLPGSDLAGIAWHCYAGTPTVMTQLHAADPALAQIVDECSPEIRSFGAPEYLISVLRNWASAAAVWNLALDPEGGPKQTDNGCPGCIGLATINEQTQSYTLTTEYYDLGQISAFVKPGAVRVDTPTFVTYGLNGSNIFTATAGLDDVAFVNPGGSHVLVTYNNSSAPITFAVQTSAGSFSDTVSPQAMTTFTWP